MSLEASAIAEIVGADHVLTGKDMEAFSRDWKGAYSWQPLAVARPANTQQVSDLVRLAAKHDVAIVPCSGNTGLNGGTSAEGALMLSMERLNNIREIRADARVAIVESGVVLSQLHDAVAEHGLSFPLTFGARGSAMIGGCLSTNAGGSNVVRYGNTRALTLGIEVVLPDGRILDLMSALHKDNTGYDLRDLFIGAEGTLGIITAAVVKLSPAPKAYATGVVAAASIPAALTMLNRLQEATGGMVEAFEYMPRSYLEGMARVLPEITPPLGYDHDHMIMVELGATAERDTTPAPDGSIPVTSLLEEVLAGLIEEGLAYDATIAQNDTQREAIWHMRESAAEIIFGYDHFVDTDVSLPLQSIEPFLEVAGKRLKELDPESNVNIVGHLGDGNLHYAALPSSGDPDLHESIREMVEDVALQFKGSFSAEHGIGLAKRGGMARRKDPVALDVMRTIKAALDPANRLNPGKVLPGN